MKYVDSPVSPSNYESPFGGTTLQLIKALVKARVSIKKESVHFFRTHEVLKLLQSLFLTFCSHKAKFLFSLYWSLVRTSLHRRQTMLQLISTLCHVCYKIRDRLGSSHDRPLQLRRRMAITCLSCLLPNITRWQQVETRETLKTLHEVDQVLSPSTREAGIMCCYVSLSITKKLICQCLLSA